MKKLIKMAIAIVLVMSMAFVTFGGTFDSAIKEMQGLKDFLTIYKDVVSTKNCKTALECIEYNNSSGSYSGRYIVKFGEYPQTGTSDMAKQPIEWIILEKSGGKALLISRYVLDYQPFINNKEMIWKSNNPNLGWETSDLRKWLNNEFYNTAFDSSDKNKIVPYSLTGDNVFILNKAEMNAYFVLDKKDWDWCTSYDTKWYGEEIYHGNPWCATEYTNYSKNKGAKGPIYWYWLRDVKLQEVTKNTNSHFGDTSLMSTSVECDYRKATDTGEIGSGEQAWKSEGVRPCVWVTYDDSVKSDREQGLEDLAGGIGKQIIGGALDSVLPGSSLLIP